jgi:ABC-type lipoprotein release transport system permease subunit
MILKNIIRNKKNSLLIILLTGSVTFLFFTGNSLIGRSDEGIRKAYIESITGDVVIQKAGDITMNLFGANAPVIDSFFTVPVLPAYDDILALVSREPGVEKFTSQVSGSAYLDLLGVREPVLLCGIDPENYFSLFEGVILREGHLLAPNEYGAMITEERAAKIEKQSGLRPAAGMPLLFTSGGTAGFKIREIPLAGIYRYQNPGQFMNEIVLVDPQTVRALSSIQVASSFVDVDEESAGLLDAEPTDLFGSKSSETYFSGTQAEGLTVNSIQNFLDSFSGAEADPVTGGDWNFILIRTGGASAFSVISSLNKKLASYGAVAVNWRIAAGQTAIVLLLVKALFNFGFFLVAVAGIIAAINILLISVFRRTREIGTLRAIGAKDFYIRRLVMGENITLAFFSGGLALFAGYWFVFLINSRNITIANNLIASLLGGPVLRLSFVPGVAAASFFLALVLGMAASILPVEMAVRIEPVVAVGRG